MSTILLIVLILLLVGAFPSWPYQPQLGIRPLRRAWRRADRGACFGLDANGAGIGTAQEFRIDTGDESVSDQAGGSFVRELPPRHSVAVS